MLGCWLLLLCSIDTLLAGAIFSDRDSRWTPEPFALSLSLAMMLVSASALVIPPVLHAAKGWIFCRTPTNV